MSEPYVDLLEVYVLAREALEKRLERIDRALTHHPYDYLVNMRYETRGKIEFLNHQIDVLSE